MIAVGLHSVVMAVPFVVLGGALGAYDDPKAWALLLLVGITGVAWLLVRASGGGQRDTPVATDRPTRFLRWAVATYGAWWVITTVVSIAPGQSFWGSFGRGHGLAALGAAILLFALVQAECRAPRALLSLIDAALLGSVPVCLLAFGQALGWDPLPPAWDPATASLRVRSTFGQHIFLGSYLVILIPLTLARLDWALETWRESPQRQAPWQIHLRPILIGCIWVVGALSIVELPSRWPAVWWWLLPWGVVGAIGWTLRGDRNVETPGARFTVILLGVLFVGQIFIVVLSRARGPFLGMLVGLSVTGCALLVRRQAWKTLATAAAGFGVVVIFLVLLNLPTSPLASLRTVPVLSRLGALVEVEPGSPGWFRLLVWRAIVSGWTRQLRGEEVISGFSSPIRSVVGYGLETQLSTLDRLTRPSLGAVEAEGRGWRAFIAVDRAHNDLLDHLVTGGLVGAALWLIVVGGVLALGVERVRTSATGPEAGVRLGCLGAILAHLVEGQFGITTPTTRALFWIWAAVLTLPPWTALSEPVRPTRPPPRIGARWLVSLIAAAALAALLGWGSTRWLVGSVAYAQGMRLWIGGEISAAHREFQRASDLVPWLSLPSETMADLSLRLAAKEGNPTRQVTLLREAEATLARARRYATPTAAHWTLTGQVAFAQARVGDRSKLAVALDAFAAAGQLRPDDPHLLPQWALAWLESGDPLRARQMAKNAVALGPEEWLAWAVLARSAHQLGDAKEARRAATEARRLAPPEARRRLENLLP